MDRFVEELKQNYKSEKDFWNDYFKARYDYYEESETL